MDIAVRRNRNYFFIASTWSNPSMRRLRKDIANIELGGRPVAWVAEIDAPELLPENYDPLLIVDKCLDAVELCKELIFIVDSDFGTMISHQGGVSQSSYIELELFQAAMHEKPIYLICIGSTFDSAVIDRILGMFNIDTNNRVLVDNYLSAQVFVESRVNGIHRNLLGNSLKSPESIKRFSGHLALLRHHDFSNKNLFEEIEFLEGRPILTSERCDLELTEQLLNEADLQTHSNRKMSRTWLAIRTLMPRHYQSSSDPKVLELWERALRTWSRFAAWRGFHAHLWLGHVAALGSLVRIIERQGKSATDVSGVKHADYVGGAMASVYYSLSKIAPSPLSGSFLNRSELYADDGLFRLGHEFQSGLYATKGSISLRRRNPNKAVQHFKKALVLAERYGHGEHRIGELLSELGWAEILTGRVISGRSNVEQGVRIMESAIAAPGFIVRGKRKLAIARALSLDIFGSISAISSANDIIDEHGLYDQRKFPLNLTAKYKVGGTNDGT